MYLQSVSSNPPDLVLKQSECWDLLRGSGGLDGLKPRSRELLEKILLSDSGVLTRRFATPEPLSLMGMDAESLYLEFERAAPRLGAGALQRACTAAGVEPSEIDALLVCSCTGYLCPGLSSYIAEALGLAPGAFLQDLLGLGCGAAVPMLEAARGVVAARPGALVATVAVEICSAAFYVDDDPGVLVSLCLFGDGAAAALWRGEGCAADFRMEGFRTVHQPAHREKIRFVNAGGKLKNQLHRSVPALAAEAVAGLYALRSGEPDCVLSHTGGRDVLDAIEEALPGVVLDEARGVLRDHGNVSSPCVLMALERALHRQGPGLNRLWLTAFGAGFAAHSCELVRGA